jgi:hypothetical protein
LLDCLHFRRSKDNLPEITYTANFETFTSCLKNIIHSEKAEPFLNAEEPSDPLLSLILGSFKQISCFGLKMKFVDRGETLRVNYMLTLSGFRFSWQERHDEGEPCCQKSGSVEFGESHPPHMRNIMTNSLVQALA